MLKQHSANAKRKGARTQKRKHTRSVSTGGSGVTWLEFFSGKRSAQQRNSGNTRRRSRKRRSTSRR